MARSRASAAAPAAESSLAPAQIVPDLTGNGATFYNKVVTPFSFKPEESEDFAPIDFATVDRGDSVEPAATSEVEAEAVAEAPAEAPAAEAPSAEVVAPTSADAPINIPKARFDEVNEERKTLKRRVEELEQRLNAPPPSAEPQPPEAYDFDAAERKFLEATLDGDLDSATALRKEINQRLIQEAVHATLQQTPKVNDAVEAVRAQTAVEAATREMNTLYPVFDPDSSSFNEALTQEAIFQTKAMIQLKGMSYPEAVRIAATNVAKLNGIAPKGTSPASASAAPKAAQVASKISAASAQPPAAPTAAPGSPEPTYDIDSMTDEEFQALPRAVRSRLRGDLG